MSEPLPTHPAPLLSGQEWRRRLTLWAGAVLVAFAAIGFAKASDAASAGFRWVFAQSPLYALLITPTVFALLAWATRGALRVTRGSGIPQAIATLVWRDEEFRKDQLSLRVAAGKLGLTVLALAGGASVGREGPTVHVGASLMHALGRAMGFTDSQRVSRFILAGAAAGIAAAFNTPLGGVVFAIEELSDAFEHRFSGTLLTAVIIAGVVSLGTIGDYAYFGRIQTRLALGEGWLAVLLCSLICGLAGGLFSRCILAMADGRPLWLGRLRSVAPIRFAASCGVFVALLGMAFGPGMFGTGYEQARSALQGSLPVDAAFGPAKWLANLVSYFAGIPGGLFSPALAVGAGIGHDLSLLFPAVSSGAWVLLGMSAYLSGVTQAPLTSAVITMELTDNHDMVLPIMATCLLARFFSAQLSHRPLYKALSDRVLAAQARFEPGQAMR